MLITFDARSLGYVTPGISGGTANHDGAVGCSVVLYPAATTVSDL